MPTIPRTQIDTSRPRGVPDVIAARAPADPTAEIISRGFSDAARAADSIARDIGWNRRNAQHQEEVAARRDSDDVYGSYLTGMGGLMHGRVGEDGAPVPGLDALDYDSLDSPDGGASKRLRAAQQEFHASEKFAALSPRARELFNARAQHAYAGFSQDAVKIDGRNTAIRNKAASEATIAASYATADAAPLDDDAAWGGAKSRAANDAAVILMGTEILNPPDLYADGPEPDAARLRFRGGEAMRAIYHAEVDKAERNMAAARAGRMLDAAKAETDLDTQESFIAQAEQFSIDHVTEEKTRAFVTQHAAALRGEALRKEQFIALDTLAQGNPYEPGDSPRRAAALKWAGPKIEAARSAGQERTLTANSAFVGAMSSVGAWPGADGNVIAVSTEESRGLLLNLLADGKLRQTDYLAHKARLDKIEASGKKDLYRRTTQEVLDVIGTDVKTLWTAGGAALAAGEDPKRKVGWYKHKTPRSELVPETKEVIVSHGGLSTSRETRPTGNTVRLDTTIERKQDLLAADIPKLIDLLVSAQSADGLMLDLDNNPLTPDQRFDARSYKAKLLADVKARQIAVDLDTQAGRMDDILSAHERGRANAEARVFLKNAKANPPAANTTTQYDTENDDAD